MRFYPQALIAAETGLPIVTLRGQAGFVVAVGTETPLNLRDIDGNVIEQPITATLLGFTPLFDTVEDVMEAEFLSGGLRTPLRSDLGIRDQVYIARDAALDVQARIESGELKGEQGDQGLPGVNAVPADEAVADYVALPSQTRTALNTTYARMGLKGLVVDVTAPPYNAVGDGVVDDFAAINAAAIAVEEAGGGTVFLPALVYSISAYLRPRSHVRYQGAGMGRTILMPFQSAAFTGHGTVEAPIESPEWFDMTWDGSRIPANNSLKGQFSEHMRNAHWERVECTMFTATGFGSDFLPGGKYINCKATYNGRGQALHGPGMSGFGIGTGRHDVEDVLVQGCEAYGNTNYGIFVEKQAGSTAPFYSKGVRFVGNISHDNGFGIGGCGVDSPIYADNQCWSNLVDGITLHEGTGLAPLGQADKRANILGNQCWNNGRDGINIDYRVNSIPASDARHLVNANRAWGNGRDGIRVESTSYASDVVRDIALRLNKCGRNAGHGIHLVTAAGAQAAVRMDDIHVEDNDLNGNGLNGLEVAVNTTRLVVKNNNGYDDQNVRTQDYGIHTAPGFTHTHATVTDNNLKHNSFTNGASFEGIWAGTSIVARNEGYSPGWTNVTGASPLTYTSGVTPETLYFTGSVTDVQLKPRAAGGFIPMGTGGTGMHSFPLEPGDTVQITYTGSATSNAKAIKRQ